MPRELCVYVYLAARHRFWDILCNRSAPGSHLSYIEEPGQADEQGQTA